MEAVVKLELLLEAEGLLIEGKRLPLLPFLYNIHLAPRNRVAHTRHSRAQDNITFPKARL
jgi:hypothetical protein